jgi:ATP-dependent Clp protease ATP-binding subunit ClpA
LLNKPEGNYFHKVDCGKLSNASEMFGKAGAYKGSEQGSDLNNFVLKMSWEPTAIGIVLLDEIEKADQSVIHALYQVLDKGEWTNKKLDNGNRNQTETIPCHNIIFIMTTNACDYLVASYKETSLTTGDDMKFKRIATDISNRLTNSFGTIYPFTRAFMGRIGKVIPFFSVADGHPDRDPLIKQEMATVIKVLIEKEQEMHSDTIKSIITTKTKYQMTKQILGMLNPDAGVRSAEKLVQSTMKDELDHLLFLKQGGVTKGSTVTFHVSSNRIDMRTTEHGIAETGSEEDNEDMKAIWG